MTPSRLLKLWPALLLLPLLAACGGDGENGPDTVPPIVENTAPTETDIPLGTDVTVTFNEKIDPSTLTSTSFFLSQSGVPLDAFISYNAETLTATLTPDLQLATSTPYTVTVTNDVTDLAGNGLNQEVVFTFTTAATDTSPPRIVSTDPADGSTQASPLSFPTAFFNESVEDNFTFTNFRVVDDLGNIVPFSVDGVIIYDDPSKSVSLLPDFDFFFDPLRTYTVTLDGPFRDLVGNIANSPVQWTFTPVFPTLTGNPTFNSTTGISTILTVPVSPTVERVDATLALYPSGALLSNSGVGLANPATPGIIKIEIPLTGVIAGIYYPSLVITDGYTYSVFYYDPQTGNYQLDRPGFTIGESTTFKAPTLDL